METQIQCDKCGRKAPVKELMATVARAEDNARLCSVCQRRTNHSRFSRGVFLISMAFLAVYCWRETAAPSATMPQLVWSLMAVLLSGHVCMIPHLLAQSLMTCLLGRKIERITIGSGRMLVQCTWKGIQFEFCHGPYGATFHAKNHGCADWRWRGILIWGGGPLTSIAITCLAISCLSPGGTKGVNIFDPLSPWILIAAGSAMTALVSLIPSFRTRWPEGAAPNDGMALYQLIRHGTWPHPRARPPALPIILEPRSSACLKILCATVLLMMAAFFLIFAAGTLGGISMGHISPLVAACCWLSVAALFLIYYGRLFVPSLPTDIQDFAFAKEDVIGLISTDDLHNVTWPENISPPIFQFNILDALFNGRCRYAEWELNGMLQRAPDNLWVQYFLSKALIIQKRFDEADAILETMLARKDLQSGTRITFHADHLMLWASQGKREQVGTKTVELLAETRSDAEKIWLLDRLSCWPLTEELRDYLPDAQAWIQQALQLAPDSLSLRGTHALLLVEANQDRIEEAEITLCEMAERGERPVDRALATFYLGILRSRRGEMNVAKNFLHQAIRLYPSSGLINMAVNKFGLPPLTEQPKTAASVLV